MDLNRTKINLFFSNPTKRYLLFNSLFYAKEHKIRHFVPIVTERLRNFASSKEKDNR